MALTESTPKVKVNNWVFRKLMEVKINNQIFRSPKEVKIDSYFDIIGLNSYNIADWLKFLSIHYPYGRKVSFTV